ncbi:MAG: ABC transporter ATP-binding protein [Clostridiales bacterium]|jgi:ABC-2 type transport system ATP-binding protein|nr:ABC transporter ATP-binding protein [Clostridiales bacterium]
MLEIVGIKRIYKNGKGLQTFSLQVQPGEIVCLIGPNGSGKSTALNIAAGVSKASEGSCLLNGMETLESAAKKDIGFLEEAPFYYGKISALDFLNLIWGIKYEGEPNFEVLRLLEKFDLLPVKDYKIRELSMGLRNRIGVISAIINYPQLIILDEPTNGLDAKGVINLKDELVSAKKRNCCVIIASHILDFLKDIGTRIVFIKNGLLEHDINNNEDVNLDEIYKSLYM